MPPSRKYQSTVEGHENGPGIVSIIKLLQGSDAPTGDRAAFFRSQILFWLIGATDGHAKNFSIFLMPGGGYRLTPFYDVLSAQTAFDRKQIPRRHFRLAMSVGNSGKYKVEEIAGRHFVEIGRKAGLGPTIIGVVIRDVLERAGDAPDRSLARMPDDFDRDIHASIAAAIARRLPLLEAGLAELK